MSLQYCYTLYLNVQRLTLRAPITPVLIICFFIFINPAAEMFPSIFHSFEAAASNDEKYFYLCKI